MTRKIKIIILAVLLLFLNGCSSNEPKIKIDKLSSKVDYFLYRDKKIYLTKNVEQFVLQFKGMSCIAKGVGSNISSEFSIDNINDKNHAFYTMKGGNEIEVRCPSDNYSYSPSFSIYLKSKDDYNINRDIRKYSISTTDEPLEVIISGKKLIFADKKDDNKSTFADLKKILGTNYEYEADNTSSILLNKIDKVIYEDNNYEYTFRLWNMKKEQDDNVVFGIYVEEK